MIEIRKETATPEFYSLEIATGKTAAFIAFSPKHNMITICCLNAAHRAYKGMGKTHFNWDDAFSGYKSADMKTLIKFAKEHFDSLRNPAAAQ